MLDLLEHNQLAYEKIKAAISDKKKKLAISHATGTGKSYLIGKLFEDYNDKKKLVLVPSVYIKEQMQKIFNKYNIVNADVMLYQKLIKLEDKEIFDMDYEVIALDEFHHDTSKVWGSKVKILIESHADSIIFGTTATPVRSDGINALDELFEGNCVSELPLSMAIAKKVVPLPVYVSALYSLDEELECLREKVKNATNTEEEKKELYNKIDSMRKQIDKSYGMPIILNKHIRDKEGKYLVFCKNKKHLAEIKDTVIEWFKIAGFKDIHSYVVHSSYEGKDKEYKAFCGDTGHNLKLLFCVNMLNEGLHLSDISGVLLLRPTCSNIIWHQQIGRCIESNNSKNPVVIDAVNNFNAVQQGNGLLQEIKEAVEKEKESGNRGSGDSDLIDIDTFFVTEYVQDVQEMFGQIEGRLQKINWKWTKSENNILIKYYPIEGVKVMDRLNRSERAVYMQAYRLGLIASDIWTEEEINLLKKYYPIEGCKVEKRLNGRSKRAIMVQARKLKIAKNPNWTEKEDDIIKKYYREEGGNTYKRLPGRSKKSCFSRARILGVIKIKTIEPWTDEEDAILSNQYPVIGSNVADKLNRTKYACITRARVLGIKYDTGSNKHKYIEYRCGKWRVGFWVNGKRKNFGTYDSEDEAVKVAVEKAKEYGKTI